MKIIYTIFAGREYFLEIQKKYLDQLLARGIITQVHLWDFTENPSDKEYLKKYEDIPGYCILHPPQSSYERTGYNKWKHYYQYYVDANYEEYDIIIKADDDIVFIDIEKMERFIKEIKKECLYFPNIINNDACAFIQTKHKIHNLLPRINSKRVRLGYSDPLTGNGGWHKNYTLAEAIHNKFLEDPNSFSISSDPIEWGSRICVNMFAGNYKTIKKYYGIYLQSGEPDDERFLSGKICGILRKPNLIVPYFNVVHFSYCNQNPVKLKENFLARYQDFAHRSIKVDLFV